MAQISVSDTIQGSRFSRKFFYSPEYLRIREYPGTFKLGGFYDSEPLRQFVSHRITGTWMVYGLAELVSDALVLAIQVGIDL